MTAAELAQPPDAARRNVATFPALAPTPLVALRRLAEALPARLALFPESHAAMAELAACLRAVGSRDRIAFRRHPAFALLQQDPLTAHAFRQPRGYPGDPTLMDLIHGTGSARVKVAGATPVGRSVNAWSTACAVSVALRERRRIIARLVDATAERAPRARVLALAAGHLREADLVHRADALDAWIALDADPESVAEIRRAHATRRAVSALAFPVNRLVAKPLAHGAFDLAYAGGPCDTLEIESARRVAAALFTALRPRGRMVFACFAPCVAEEGYMDSCMNWRPPCRDEAAVRHVLDALPAGDVARTEVFRGANGVLLYAFAERRG